MTKSTKNLVLGIGILSMLSGGYSYFEGGEIFDTLIGVFIGASLIGSLYLNKCSMQK